MRKIWFLLLIFLAALTSTPTAHSFDVPLLTWERGRVQQVVLGGGAYTNNWNVTLEGNGIKPLTFTISEKNDAGYVVYSLKVPADLPLGPYSIFTSGKGSPKTVVAGVSLVQAQTITPTSSPFDLSLIVALFATLTALLNVLRGDKYRRISYQQSQDIYFEDPHMGLASTVLNLPQRIRYSSLRDLRKSLFSFLLVQEGELLYRISRPIFGLMPIFGLVAGSIAGIEVQKNGGIATTGFGIFVAVLIIAIVDPISGIFATISFWAIQLFAGDLWSIRDLLIVGSVSLAWIGAPLISALVFHTLSEIRDEIQTSAFTPINMSSSLISTIFGVLTFFLGSLLVNSLIFTEAPGRIVDSSVISVIASALLARRIIEIKIFHNPTNLMLERKNFDIARAVSPLVAILVNIAIFGFLYIWTESSVRSLFLSVLFSLPYYLSFIKLKMNVGFSFNRNLVAECVIIFLVTFILYRQVSSKPLLVDQMASIFLLLSAIPMVLHALFSAVYAKREIQGIIQL